MIRTLAFLCLCVETYSAKLTEWDPPVARRFLVPIKSEIVMTVDKSDVLEFLLFDYFSDDNLVEGQKISIELADKNLVEVDSKHTPLLQLINQGAELGQLPFLQESGQSVSNSTTFRISQMSNIPRHQFAQFLKFCIYVRMADTDGKL